MGRRLWLITQRLERNRHGDVVDVLERSYLEYYGKFVERIQPLPNLHRALSSDFDYEGLIISGGGDLPNHFLSDENLSPGEDTLAEEKFDVQSKYLDEAFRDGKKILAVCYGMMLANVYLRGTLTYDVHHGDLSRQPRMNHEISIQNDPWTDGVSKTFVNNYHRNGITANDLSCDLVPLAIDEGFGLVELARHKSKKLLCIQWHPERTSPDDEFNRRLLQSFFCDETE